MGVLIMSSLHTLHHASHEALQRVRAAAQAGDALLLREDAVLLARDSAIAESLFAESVFAACFALQADVDARGLRAMLPEPIRLVDDAGFVALSLQHARVIAWR